MKYEFLKVCCDVTKTATKISQSKYLIDGLYPVYDQGKEKIGGYVNTNEGIASDFPYIIFGDHTRAIKYVDNACFIGADGVKLLKVTNDSFIPKYVYYSMVANPVESQGYSRHFKLLKETKIKFVSQEQQIIIVNELDFITYMISFKKNELIYLDELIKSRFIELFDNKEYPIMTIEQTCNLKSGTTFDKSNELSIGDLLYCKVSDMNLEGNEKYMTTSKTYVSYNIGKKSSIPKNSVIFPKRGGAIGTNKKRLLLEDTCVDLNTMGVTPGKLLHHQYLYQYFINIDLGALCDGSTIPQLNNKNIGPLEISVPPMDIQQEFANFVELIDKSKFIVQQQIKELQELLDSKMDEYFR